MQGMAKITVPLLVDKKHIGQRITAVTAYDAPTALMVDEAGIDVILVGDSVGNVVLGRPNTLSVTLEEMLHHTRAVTSAPRRALVVGDMPYMSYHAGADEAVANAGRFVKEAGAAAVKLEGPRPSLVKKMVKAELSVMGHLGLTPQSLHRMGGFRVQATSPEARDRLLEGALRLEDAGAFAIVLEGVPREVAALVTRRLTIPTIGIGAGPECDGQILVLHDLLGLGNDKPPKFVRRYANLMELGRTAVAAYIRDVETGRFPSDAESYHAPSMLPIAEVAKDEDWL